MTDRDYRNEDTSTESWIGSRLGVTDLLFAGSDRSFGANQFYGPYTSWERTKGWFAAGRQELGSRTVAAFGYRRHTDDFVLFRNDPAAYENNHIDGSWQGSLRETVSVRKNSVLLMGLEADGDSINSYNLSGGVRSFALGLHARNRGAGYVDLDLRPAEQRWSLSMGAREEDFFGRSAGCVFARAGRQSSRGNAIENRAPAAAMDSGFLHTPISTTPIRHERWAMRTSGRNRPGRAMPVRIGRRRQSSHSRQPDSIRNSTTRSTT